jgi:hypothetical protein
VRYGRLPVDPVGGLAIPWERTTDRQVSTVISLIRINPPDRIGAMIQRTATHRSQDLAI